VTVPRWGTGLAARAGAAVEMMGQGEARAMMQLPWALAFML